MKTKGKSRFSGVAIVYGLTDGNGNIFYVGCTTKPLEVRLGGHISEAKANVSWTNIEKNHTIRSLNYQVGIKELDRKKVSGKTSYAAQRKAQDLERKWIRRCLDLYELVNRQHSSSDYGKGSKKRIKEKFRPKN